MSGAGVLHAVQAWELLPWGLHADLQATCSGEALSDRHHTANQQPTQPDPTNQPNYPPLRLLLTPAVCRSFRIYFQRLVSPLVSSEQRPPPLKLGSHWQLWSWIIPVFAVSDQALLETAGLDALVGWWVHALTRLETLCCS